MVAEPPPTVHTPFGYEDPQYMFDTPQSEGFGMGEMEKIKEQCQTLERRLRDIEGNDVFGASAMDICLVPDLVLPPKFKMSDFKKYKRHTCLKSHLIMYFHKMVAYSQNDKLLIHYFHDSLRGSFFKWYMGLEKTCI